MTRSWRCALAMAALLATSTTVWAQGGGASSTGTIQGRVSDAQGGVLPGVTVTATSPAMMGAQTQVTSDSGTYRFPAVPPGVYTVTYELPGFTTVKRERIDIALGFTATLNIELGVASLQESVTVTGDTPVIDTSATRVQQNFKIEALESLPGARDMWSLLSATPAVQMQRTDVGGNRAGTQTGYTAYGFTGQTRVLVEGINTTEGTNGAGFYFDFGSFEEVFMGTAGQGAEMPHPGVQSQFLAKSGGNSFHGQAYADITRNALQGSNISDDQLATGIREGSNEMATYRDLNVNIGGPIARDKLWWFFSYRDQKNEIEQPNFRFDKLFETRLWNPSGKVTYQMSNNHKLIGYYQWGQKIQPTRTFSASYFYESEDSTRIQDSGSWVYKGEWNGTLSDRLYVEARYGEFGYQFPQLGNSDQPWREDSDTRIATGGDQRQQLDRQRRQLTGAASYFLDGFAGSHSIKIGGEANFETGWEGFEYLRPGNVRHYFASGVARQVDVAFPTASCTVGDLSARDCLLSIAKLDHQNAFVSDAWNRGRLTLNLGLRWDRYKSHVPEQQQLAATTAGVSVPAIDYAAQTFFTWNSVVPRIGAVYDLFGSGRTVVKASYGFFRHNPGITPAEDANPNQASKYIRYQWTDLNGDRLFQAGEQGSILQNNLTGGQSIDPDIRQPKTHEFSAFLEHQLAETLGVRVGYVDKRSSDLFQLYSYLRPIGLYSQTFNFNDTGIDGVANTADDQVLTLFGIPRDQVTAENAARRVQNTDAIGRYKTIEASMTKRMSQRFSVNFGFGYTWTTENASTYRTNTVSPSVAANSPNDTSRHEFTTFGLNASGSYEGPLGLRFSPLLRFTQGTPWGRTITLTSPATAPLFSGTILVEPVGTRRMDNILVFDLKTEKSVPLGGSRRLRAFLDLYNLFNSNAADTISFATGPTFGDPTAIIGPRTARIGARFEF